MMRARYSARGPAMLGLGLAFLLVFVVAGWAMVAPVGGVIIAAGRVEADLNALPVRSSQSGEVEQLLMREGQEVAKNAALVVLDSSDLAIEAEKLSRHLAEILAKKCRFQAEAGRAREIDFSMLQAEGSAFDTEPLMQSQSHLFALRLQTEAAANDRLARRQQQTREQMRGLRAQRDSILIQLALVEEELAAKRLLVGQGVVAASNVNELVREAAALNGQANGLSAAMAEAESRLQEIALEIEGRHANFAEQAATKLGEMSDAERDLRAQLQHLAARIDRATLRSPIDGVVTELAISGPGVLISPDEVLASIVPIDQPLSVHSQILPFDIDRLFVGQSVRLRFVTLDPQGDIEWPGTVSSISPVALSDPGSDAQFFRIWIRMEDWADDQSHLQRPPDLRPGLPVDVMIPTGSKTPMSYLLGPLGTAFARSFRDH